MVVYILIAVVIVFFILAALVLLLVMEKGSEEEKKKDEESNASSFDPAVYESRGALLSPAELLFYRVLKDVLRHPTDPGGADQAVVMSKVRVVDLVGVKKGLERSVYRSALNRIKSKHVDFVLLDPAELEVLSVIELDDASHNAKKVQERDALVDAVYGAAGVPILHVPAKRSYVKEDVARMIREAMGR